MSNIVFNTSPIIVVLLAGLILKEKISVVDMFAALGAFAGVYLVVDLGSEEVDDKSQLIGIALAATSSLFSSFAYVTLRSLNKRKDTHFLFSPFYLSILSLTIPLVANLIHPGTLHPSLYFGAPLPYLIVAALGAYGFQTFMSVAYKYENASKLTPFMYLSIIGTFIADVTLFNFTYTGREIIGASLILICIASPWAYKYFTKKEDE